MLPTPLQDVVLRLTKTLDSPRPFDEQTTNRLTELAAELRASAEWSDTDARGLVAQICEQIDAIEASGGQDEDVVVLLASIAAELLASTTAPAPDDPIVTGFLDDRADSLDELEELALALESTEEEQHLDGIRRIIHSIKGDAGVLGLDGLSRLCHELENALEHAVPRGAAQLTLEAVSSMRRIFAMLAGEPAPVEHVPSAMVVEQAFAPDDLSEADQELVGEFVVEAREHLEAIDGSLLQLESGDKSEQEEAVNAAFRAFHTIKGLAGFLNLNLIMGLAHEAEAMLHRVRSEEIVLTERMVTTALQVGDGLKSLILAVERGLGGDGKIVAPPEYGRLLDAIEAAMRDSKDRGSFAAATSIAEPRSEFGPSEPAGDTTRSSSGTSNVRGTLKVDASRLDRLVDTIGELVIAEAMVSQCDELDLDGSVRLPALLNQLDKTTRELQEMAMSLRMVPIRSTFRRMARLARDVSHKLGKRVEFVTRGDDTELDKTVVDVIGDPLVHMVRNAIDHGIEKTAEERERAGKSGAGRIELRAFHQGGSIHVEIEDDGKGLDRNVILEKARARGIVGDEADNMSDSDVFGLIFAPGFSTAATVTEVSGRGVGLDVVRRNIESLRGRVEIHSTLGKGSVFSIRLPLTLAIIDGMVVRVGKRRYIVPTLSILRMFRPHNAEISTVLDRGRVLRVGDELVPLHRLDDMFGLGHSSEELDSMSAMVVESASGNFAFLVDELLGQQQIVIKPLGESLGGLTGFAGGAVMPDGTVGLILDIAGLAKLAAETPAGGSRKARTPALQESHDVTAA